MFKNLANLAGMLRKAQQLSQQLDQLKAQLKSQRVTGSAGGGMVTVEVNGLGELVRVTIDPLLVERGEREMIESLIPPAVQQAQEKARSLHQEAVKSLGFDLDVPMLRDLFEQLNVSPDDEAS